MRSRGADRPDDEADQRNEQPGKSRRLFGRGRPEPAEPEEVPREETGWLDDLRSAKQERAAIGPGKPTDGRASKSGKVAPGPRDEPPEPPAEPRSAAAPSSPAGPPDSAPSPFGRSGVTGRPVSSSPAAPTSGGARARFEGEQPGRRAAGEPTGGWRTTDQASGRHTSAFSLGDLSADEPTPGHGRRAIDPGQMSGRDRRGPSAGPTSGAPIPGRPVSGGPVSGGPVSGGPVSGGPVSGGPVSGGPVSGLARCRVARCRRPGVGARCRLARCRLARCRLARCSPG